MYCGSLYPYWSNDAQCRWCMMECELCILALIRRSRRKQIVVPRDIFNKVATPTYRSIQFLFLLDNHNEHSLPLLPFVTDFKTLFITDESSSYYLFIHSRLRGHSLTYSKTFCQRIWIRSILGFLSSPNSYQYKYHLTQPLQCFFFLMWTESISPYSLAIASASNSSNYIGRFHNPNNPHSSISSMDVIIVHAYSSFILSRSII